MWQHLFMCTYAYGGCVHVSQFTLPLYWTYKHSRMYYHSFQRDTVVARCYGERELFRSIRTASLFKLPVTVRRFDIKLPTCRRASSSLSKQRKLKNIYISERSAGPSWCTYNTNLLPAPKYVILEDTVLFEILRGIIGLVIG